MFAFLIESVQHNTSVSELPWSRKKQKTPTELNDYSTRPIDGVYCNVLSVSVIYARTAFRLRRVFDAFSALTDGSLS